MPKNYLHVANFFDADRLTAVAGEVMTIGMITKVSDFGNGERKLMKLADADAALLVSGKFAIVTKEAVDADEVSESTANLSETGTRIVSIATNDLVLELRKGAKIEYSTDLLHDSLNPANGGTLPAAGDALGIKSSLWCANTGVASSIVSPVVGRVLRVHGAGASAIVVIELI